MDEFEKIEEKLQGQDWKGDPEKALADVGGDSLKKIRRQRKISVTFSFMSQPARF